MMSKGTGKVFAVDAEWGFSGARIGRSTAFQPIIFCALDLDTGQRYSYWANEGDRLSSFIRANSDATYVAHYATAEMGYLLRYQIPLPDRWCCTYLEFRRATNSSERIPAGLIDCLAYYDEPHIDSADKELMREKCLVLDFDDEDKGDIEEYCHGDCEAAGWIYDRLGSPEMGIVDLEYLKSVALTELRGIPFDVRTCQLIRRARVSIRKELIATVNKTVKLFDDDGNFRRRALFEWAHSQGIDWPLTWSKEAQRHYRSTSDEALEIVEYRHRFLAEFRQIKKTLTSLNLRGCPWDYKSKRHYFLTSYAGTITGRNTPSAFIFSAAKWMRSVIHAPKGYILINCDFVAQEIGIAAALSKDPALWKVYQSNDAHLAFAQIAGAVPEWTTKQEYEIIADKYKNVRKQYKSVSLGVIYGQSYWGISDRLGVTKQVAEDLVKQHKRLFPKYWKWIDGKVLRAFLEGEMHSPLGWRVTVPKGSNRRTWMNWPIQSAGADIMKLTMIYLNRQGVEVLASIHDGFLIQCRREDYKLCRKAIRWACDTAVDQVIPGFPLKIEMKLFRKRYQEADENAEKLWAKICGHLIEWYPDETKHLR